MTTPQEKAQSSFSGSSYSNSQMVTVRLSPSQGLTSGSFSAGWFHHSNFISVKSRACPTVTSPVIRTRFCPSSAIPAVPHRVSAQINSHPQDTNIPPLFTTSLHLHLLHLQLHSSDVPLMSHNRNLFTHSFIY